MTERNQGAPPGARPGSGPRARASARRLDELVAAAAAVRPVLDDVMRARVAARLHRDFEAMVARSQQGGPAWICWEERGDATDEMCDDSADCEADDDEIDSADREADDEVDAALQLPRGRPIDPATLPMPPRADPETKQARRGGWTRLLLLASAAVAFTCGVTLVHSLRASTEDEQALMLMDPIIRTSAPRPTPGDALFAIRDERGRIIAAALPSDGGMRTARGAPSIEAEDYTRCVNERAAGLPSSEDCFRDVRQRFPSSIWDSLVLAASAVTAVSEPRCGEALPLLREYLAHYAKRGEAKRITHLYKKCQLSLRAAGATAAPSEPRRPDQPLPPSRPSRAEADRAP